MQVVLYEYQNGNDKKIGTYKTGVDGLNALEKLYNDKYKADGYCLAKKDFAIYRGADWQIAWLEEK